ncbi:hypothetical protein EDC04DRAFT_2893723 [Pisolithus marmoratus]|nr:hypothetical protein EDC04DRAFT_2893723 [Pisolithus marmoratus]
MFVVCRELPLPVASLEAQLARSGNVHLNVFIINLPYEYYQPEVRFLDVLVSSADRWRCVYIQDMVPTILRALQGLKFPSLKDVLVYNMYRISSYPRFLLPDQAPALGSLKLDYLFPTPEFAAATTLTALELTFGGHQDQNMKPLFVLTQSLTVLSLAGDTAGWTLLPDSIHLPLLEVFKLAVDNPQPLMQAIVAPKLVYFDYSNYPSYSHTVHVSFGTGLKFSHVQKIALNFWYRVEDGDALCREFRGAQHSQQIIGQASKA